MRLQDWEVTIQTIAAECNRDLDGANEILMAWRVTLEKEPHLLQPFRIDQIVREARQRIIQVRRFEAPKEVPSHKREIFDAVQRADSVSE